MGRKMFTTVGIDALTLAALCEIANKETGGRITAALKKVVTEAYDSADGGYRDHLRR